MKPQSNSGFSGFHRRRFFERLALVVTGFGITRTSSGADKTAAFDGGKEIVFRESNAIFPNPERGFYSQRATHNLWSLDSLRSKGTSLVLITCDLRNSRDRTIGGDKLAELETALKAAERAGLKVIFRAAYGFTDKDYRVDPKDMGLIAAHIGQMGKVLTDHRDIVWSIQAGMLGPWGEWHGSNWGDPPSLDARQRVLFAWLDATPSTISVHVRRPMFVRDIFANEPGGYDLADAAAFNGSRLARTGWHDDSYLALPNDAGTYVARGWDRERELQWCHRHGRFAPFGGETVGKAAETPIEQVIRELELTRATYLNLDYHPQAIKRWRETEYRGENMLQHIARRLGYRFVAHRLNYTLAKPGGEQRWELSLKNAGFAPLYLPKRVEVATFKEGSPKPERVFPVGNVDLRRVLPEAGLVAIQGTMAALPGPWRWGIRFADDSERLREEGRYAIRLANEDFEFLEASGWNVLPRPFSPN